MIDFLKGKSPLGGSGYAADGMDEKIMAAGSLVAGIALFMLSMIMMIAIGFFAGALVLTERIAHQCIGPDCDPPRPRALLPERTPDLA